MPVPKSRAIREVAGVFLRLGLTAFGGPAGHIAIMRDEFVRRRGWLDDGVFVDLMGVANLIPGPTSTELAMHIGHRRAGWAGLVVAGLAFLLSGGGHRRRPGTGWLIAGGAAIGVTRWLLAPG